MAGETLRTIAEVLASFPDNSSRLITPLDARDMIVTEAVNVGYLEPMTLPFTIPVVADTPVSINQAMPDFEFVGNFWRVDGNRAFVENYTTYTPPIIVNPGTFRSSAFNLSMNVQKIGTGTDTYRIEWFKNGTPFGNPLIFDVDDVDPFYVAVRADDLTDISLSDVFDVRVTGVGTGDDLQVNQLQMRATGAPT